MVRGKPEAHEIFLDGIRAPLAEGQVVFRGTTLIAMAFYGHANIRIILEEISGLLQRLRASGRIAAES